MDFNPIKSWKYFRSIFEEQNIISVIDENDQDYIDDFIYEGIIPHPEILRQYIQDLNLYEIYSVDGGHAQGRVKKGVKRERGQINFTGFDVETGPDMVNLGFKIAMGIHCAFGRSSTAGGK